MTNEGTTQMSDSSAAAPVGVDVNLVLAGFESEITRLTRRVVFAESEAHTLRAQVQQHLARIADLEQQVGTDAPPDTEGSAGT